MSASSPSALDRATAELRRRLKTGEYPPGSDLPPSRVLAGDLGVSPGTVRRALTRLDAAGLTASRRGRPRLACSAAAGMQATRYELLAATLRGSITSGELAAGSRLPAENMLAEAHGVSRATARRALQLLESDGAVVLRAGRRYVAGTSSSPELAYERVAAAIRRQTSHDQGRSRQLPGETQLAAEYGVSRPTIRKALDLLREEGLVYSEPKVGWFTASPSRRLPDRE